MAVPTFLSSSFRFLTVKGVTDVQTIMDNFENEVLSNVPAWTQPSADLYQSPTDAAGRWFDMLLTRVNQYMLGMRLRDSTGMTISDRRMNIVSANAVDADIPSSLRQMGHP